MTVLFLLLWFIYLNVPQPEEDEGIEVSLGEDMMLTGGGLPDAAPYEPQVVPETTAPKQAAVEPLLTQEDESAMQAAKEEKKRQEAIAKAQQMASLFGNTESADGANGQAGDEGTANNGNPLGHGSMGGNSWSLNGRYLVGALPKPASNFSQEGKVVVMITVNKEGYVVSARAGQGTTISDEATRQLAVKADMKAQFNMVDHPNAVMGTITYYFKFK